MRKIILISALAASAAAADWTPHPAVQDIHVLRAYRAGKNSFVESTDRHAGFWNRKGFRATLLDVKGTGSLRHIWSTWRKEGPYFEWQFFVDGESEPSIRGSLDQLVAAAEQIAASPNPASSVPLAPDKRDYNFYLPVPFEKSLRIDVVQQTDTVGLFFAQLDYRTEDDSLRGARLRARNDGGRISLSYEGWQPQPRVPIRFEEVRFPRRQIQPGEQVVLGVVEGPAIIRRLDLQAPLFAPLRLRVRYDGARGFAVDAPTSRYFGEFQGASSERFDDERAASYLPMPFRQRCEVFLDNEGGQPVEAALALSVERVARFGPEWGYLHALHHQSPLTTGHHLHQVLYVRGRGHWLGMSLFNTGHDHGGGDFAVIDGESEKPAFLHGVNGEDYFTFAWFGRGQHQPYAQAIANDRGRYRHHFENPYPFRHSIQIEWGAFPKLRPESVAVWYQASPEDTTVRLGAPSIRETWDAFGPVPIRGSGLFAGLPSVADLDAGKRFLIQNEGESFESGWLWEETEGPSLNLTYLARHGVPVNPENRLGGNGHAFLARKRFLSKTAGPLEAWLSHDDPIEVTLNGKVVYLRGEPCNGFETAMFTLPVRAGENEIVVRLANYFNVSFNWTGFSLWMRNGEGIAVRLSDLICQPSPVTGVIPVAR